MPDIQKRHKPFGAACVAVTTTEELSGGQLVSLSATLSQQLAPTHGQLDTDTCSQTNPGLFLYILNDPQPEPANRKNEQNNNMAKSITQVLSVPCTTTYSEFK
ncbi:unnamed protein product [Boreogadus saida]